MRLSTAQKIPVDICVLILDHLSVKDLRALEVAYPDFPRLTQLAKWRCMLRLTTLITEGTSHIFATIDGDRYYYKNNRHGSWRQTSLYGRAAPARPYEPFSQSLQFTREFTGTRTAPKMRLTPDLQLQWYWPSYAPRDLSGAPGEVVTAVVLFKLGSEKLCIEYDTEDILIHSPVSLNYHEDGEHLTRTVAHRVPLRKVTWRKDDDGDAQTKSYELPKTSVELLGGDAFVKVSFVERVPTRPSFFWKGPATMQSFEMQWNLRLSEWNCTPKVFEKWSETQIPMESR